MPGGLGSQERQKGRRRWVFRTCQRNGINDGRMTVFGEKPHRSDLRLGQRVGGVDNAHRRRARRNKSEGRAHIVGLRDLVFDRRPKPKMLQCGLAIDPRRNRIYQRHSQPTVAQHLGKGQFRCDSKCDGGLSLYDQCQAISQKVLARGRQNFFRPFKVVHPRNIG